jgi:hypothetical protein
VMSFQIVDKRPSNFSRGPFVIHAFKCLALLIINFGIKLLEKGENRLAFRGRSASLLGRTGLRGLARLADPAGVEPFSPNAKGYLNLSFF